MAYTVPTSEPEKLRAGDTATWIRELSDYLPADSWILYYAATTASAQILITGSDNGDGRHLVDVAKATTAAWDAGIYRIIGYVDNGTDRHEVYDNYLEITPDLSAATSGVEARSTVKQTLDALDAVILGKASKDQLSYSIAGRSLSHYSPEELLTWRREYLRLWHAEQDALNAASGKSSRRYLKIRPKRAR